MKCLSYSISSLPLKEDEEAAKAEAEEKKIIDPNGDEVTVKRAKNIIEYDTSSHLIVLIRWQIKAAVLGMKMLLLCLYGCLGYCLKNKLNIKCRSAEFHLRS